MLEFSLFKTNFPIPKGTGNIVREPPDHTGNEPTLDIHLRGSGQGIKINKITNTCI